MECRVAPSNLFGGGLAYEFLVSFFAGNCSTGGNLIPLSFIGMGMANMQLLGFAQETFC
jgi:hypothetical protein